MDVNSENILSGSKLKLSKNFCNLLLLSNILNKKPLKKNYNFWHKKIILSMYPNLVIFKDTASRLFTK